METSKQRKALEFVASMDDSSYTTYDVVTAVQMARAALAEPQRNCDLYATAEEARQAWLGDAGNWDGFGSPRLELHEWLFAPAKEQEGGDGARKALVAIKTLTESHAHELSELGTVHRTAKALFLEGGDNAD